MCHQNHAYIFVHNSKEDTQALYAGMCVCLLLSLSLSPSYFLTNYEAA